MQVAAQAAALPFSLSTDFVQALDALGPFGHTPHVAVAISGGADSTALALLADAWARARGGRVTALTVDHGLREESRAEAEQVAALVRARGIAHAILTPPHDHGSNNLQEAARGWRYDALAEWCAAHDVLHCLVAHHAGDQRETVALHRQRGETVDGPAGMSAARNYRGVRFLRPLLSVEKMALVQYLEAQQISWIEDPSNRNAKFARVRMRQDLREDDVARAALARVAADEGSARAVRDDAFAKIAARLVTISPVGFAEFSQASWLKLESERATQLLADLLVTISGATLRPRRSETERLFAAMGGAFRKRTLLGCEISLSRGIVRVAREAARVDGPVILEGRGVLVWDKRFRVQYDTKEPLTLRALGPNQLKLPAATPCVVHLDAAPALPHITGIVDGLPAGARVTIGFSPAKPLAAAPFWWLNISET